MSSLHVFSDMRCTETVRSLLVMLVGVCKQYMGFRFDLSWLLWYYFYNLSDCVMLSTCDLTHEADED